MTDGPARSGRPVPGDDEPLSIAYLTYRGKPHVGGQGVYISPATNTVVAYFMTGTGSDGPETVARAIVNSLGGR